MIIKPNMLARIEKPQLRSGVRTSTGLASGERFHLTMLVLSQAIPMS